LCFLAVTAAFVERAAHLVGDCGAELEAGGWSGGARAAAVLLTDAVPFWEGW
jgi:hypothetical protein